MLLRDTGEGTHGIKRKCIEERGGRCVSQRMKAAWVFVIYIASTSDVSKTELEICLNQIHFVHTFYELSIYPDGDLLNATLKKGLHIHDKV